MAMMQPTKTYKDEADLPKNLGSMEPDVGPPPSEKPPTMAPTDPNKAGDTGEPDGMTPEQEGIPVQEIQSYFDNLPDEEKAFLAAHMSPEFIRAIGIVSGKEVADYLNQFADAETVLVPVPRQMAEQYMAQQKQPGPAVQQGAPQPQNTGMMAPRQATATL